MYANAGRSLWLWNPATPRRSLAPDPKILSPWDQALDEALSWAYAPLAFDYACGRLKTRAKSVYSLRYESSQRRHHHEHDSPDYRHSPDLWWTPAAQRWIAWRRVLPEWRGPRASHRPTRRTVPLGSGSPRFAIALIRVLQAPPAPLFLDGPVCYRVEGRTWPMAWLRRWRRALAACMKEKSMRSTKMIVFALLNETGGCFLDPGLGLLVEHPLDQLPKRVGWNRLPQDGNSRTARGDVQVAGRYSRSHEDHTRSQVRPRLRNFLVQRLTVHLGEGPSG